MNAQNFADTEPAINCVLDAQSEHAKLSGFTSRNVRDEAPRAGEKALGDFEAMTLDDLLCRWHAWVHPINPTTGHAATSTGFDSYRTSRQYDDANGALDADVEHRTMRELAHHVAALPDPMPAALRIHAANLAHGCAVMHSPRLPSGPALDTLVQLSRRALWRRLVQAGVV